jgi:hypothetical protein
MDVVNKERNMSEHQLRVLHLENRLHCVEQLLEAERVRNFSLRKLLCEMRFMAKPFLLKLDKIRDFKE